jgi:hypothetical protein
MPSLNTALTNPITNPEKIKQQNAVFVAQQISKVLLQEVKNNNL